MHNFILLEGSRLLLLAAGLLGLLEMPMSESESTFSTLAEADDDAAAFGWVLAATVQHCQCHYTHVRQHINGC